MKRQTPAYANDSGFVSDSISTIELSQPVIMLIFVLVFRKLVVNVPFYLLKPNLLNRTNISR